MAVNTKSAPTSSEKTSKHNDTIFLHSTEASSEPTTTERLRQLDMLARGFSYSLYFLEQKQAEVVSTKNVVYPRIAYKDAVPPDIRNFLGLEDNDIFEGKFNVNRGNENISTARKNIEQLMSVYALKVYRQRKLEGNPLITAQSIKQFIETVLRNRITPGVINRIPHKSLIALVGLEGYAYLLVFNRLNKISQKWENPIERTDGKFLKEKLLAHLGTDIVVIDALVKMKQMLTTQSSEVDANKFIKYEKIVISGYRTFI